MNFAQIRNAIIGANQPIETPFGQKPLIYADYTASGRSLTWIEDWIQGRVMPFYANTHTEFSLTGAQTTRYREQAREQIRRAVKGTDNDKVIFCGSGATAAIDKLIGLLGIRIPQGLDQKHQLSQHIPAEQRPVVFVGPYEHHSNELPWRESIADVVTIGLDANEQIDQAQLIEQLKRYETRPLKIGSFSAASNVTGILSDVEGITKILKQHQALACWDYAAAGPYVAINMNGSAPIDAVYLSPHKFVGGPGTPGVLVVKQHVASNAVPHVVGGGTVSYVSPERHQYVTNIEQREEGGTPAIIEAIRAGLVFQLQNAVGVARIEAAEHRITRKVLKRLGKIPNISILGNPDAERLAIFSLRFRHGRFDLHHGFVTAVLNDVFGIQVRGGCSCAGPYGHHLLDISIEHSDQIEREVSKGTGALKPGWVRFNINYFTDEAEMDYVLQAIEMTAQHGWQLLPFYQLDPKSGLWRFQGKASSELNDLDVFANPFPEQNNTASKPNQTPDFKGLLAAAREVFFHHDPNWQICHTSLSPSAEALRWFAVAPCEKPAPQTPTSSNWWQRLVTQWRHKQA